MRFAVVQSDIRHLVNEAVDGMLTVDDATHYIMSIILTEAWTRKDGDVVTLAKMTDTEYRMLDMWVRANWPSHRGSRIQFIKDMREVFPGLSLAAAHHLTPRNDA